MQLLNGTATLSSTVGIIAVAGAGVAALSLILGLSLTLRLRRLRAEQKLVLGDRKQDLVAHAAGLQGQFEALNGYLQDVAARLDQRMGAAEDRIDGAIAYRSLIRYDAYGEMSGQQSTSIALLDASRSGVVLSSIHHRDQARLYAKQVRDGRGEYELSPEEDEAIRVALAGGSEPATPASR